MREILFRALDKVHNDIKEVAVINWVEQTVLLWNKRGNVRITIKRNFDDIELMQYTWLTDKNGMKIYEGDIVQCHAIRFPNGIWYYSTKITIDDFIYDSYGIGQYDECEVIGNIHDNPELAEGGDT